MQDSNLRDLKEYTLKLLQTWAPHSHPEHLRSMVVVHQNAPTHLVVVTKKVSSLKSHEKYLEATVIRWNSHNPADVGDRTLKDWKTFLPSVKLAA